MAEQHIADLITIRNFPPVVHPAHASELMNNPREDALGSWLGGYVIATAEQRRLLDDIFPSLAWKTHGRALLIHGLYGTGKSHLLLVLHLLAALDASWEPFLGSHPTYRRYSLAIQKRKFLLVHFSLDEYAPAVSLEQALRLETEKVLQQAGVIAPELWQNALSRADAWRALLAGCQECGHEGLVLLVDEMSLFLAAKVPERREEDAAFLQFLAEMTTRYPLWLLGATQRNLSDSGALATHSWRQVEDRFQRYPLPVQAIGEMLRDRLVERRDPAAIRAIINDYLVPRVSQLGITYTSIELHFHWPFHPQAIAMICDAANTYLSPHRSLVELLQRLSSSGLSELPTTRLLTAVDLYSLIADDLLLDERLQSLWKAVDLLQRTAESLPEAAFSTQLISLLALAWLGERSLTVEQLRSLLFNGETAPEVRQISQFLHQLRRRVACLQVVRQPDAEAEIFSLALDDADGVAALAMMEEKLREYSAHDPRVLEMTFTAGEQTPFLARLLTGSSVRQAVYWAGVERNVEMLYALPTSEMLLNAVEAVRASNADGVLFLLAPGDEISAYNIQLDEIPGQFSAAVRCWQPALPAEHDWALWQGFSAWLQVGEEQADNARGRRIRKRCLERAEELRPAVAETISRCYLRGSCWSLDGKSNPIANCDSWEEALADIFSTPFSALFPYCQAVYQHGAVTQNACRMLQEYLITPGQVRIDSPLLTVEYIERILLPLHCARIQSEEAIITPPATDLLAPILASAANKPISIADAVKLLARTPAGLPAQIALLVIGCAIRTGVLRGLDAFLQPLSPDCMPGEGAAFLAIADVPDENSRQLLNKLADYFGISDEEWPLRVVLLENSLREKAQRVAERLLAVETTIADWSTSLQLMPWIFKETTLLLEVMLRFSQSDASLMTSLKILGDDAAAKLEAWQQLLNACEWWREFHPSVMLAVSAVLPDNLRAEAISCCGELANGEMAFADLAAIGSRLDNLRQQFNASYRQWHDSLFGPEAVARLRTVFDSAEFRALKILLTLPLPVPETAAFAIQALSQARSGYCPGNDMEAVYGCCPRCKLQYAAENPMPDAKILPVKIKQALAEYVELLANHLWSKNNKERIARAPQAIATAAEQLFKWQVNDDAEQLLAALHEPLPSWLCRTAHSSGMRRCNDFQGLLTGRELTPRETEEYFRAWLDPEGELTEDSVLLFE